MTAANPERPPAHQRMSSRPPETTTSRRDLRLPRVGDECVPGRHVVRRAVGIILATFIAIVLIGGVASLRMMMDVTVDADGTIEPLEVWPVRTRTAGVIASVLVTAGDTVHQGQIVARMDSIAAVEAERTLHFQYEESRVDYARALAAAPLDRQQQEELVVQADAKVIQARATLLERLTEYRLGENVDSVLRTYVSGGHVAIDRAVADVRSAEADHRAAVARLAEVGLDSIDLEKRRVELARLRSAIDAAEAQRNRLSIIAPAEGIVLTGQLERMTGAYVQPGDQLMEVAAVGRWRAVLFASERNVHDVRVGDAVTLEIPALSVLDGDRLRGRVTSVAIQPAGAVSAGAESPGGVRSPGEYRIVATLDRAQIDSIGINQFRRGYAAKGKIVTRSGRIASLALGSLRERLGAIR